MAPLWKIPPAEFVSDPHWFPATLDLKEGAVGFVRTDRDSLARQSFLDNRWKRPQPELKWAPFRDLEFARDSPPARLNFIWHTAFCSSTAISRVLDVPGKSLGLREPEALTLLADLKRTKGGAVPADIARTLFALLARRFSAGEGITIKPSNAANYALAEAANATSGRWLMLYSDCTSFLTAVARRGEARRAHVRKLFEKVAGDNVQNRQWPIENYFALTDLQIAAFCWHLQIAELRRAMATCAAGRTASLDCDAFLADPAGTAGAMDRFFQLGIDAERLAEATGNQLARDAKAPDSRFEISDRRGEWARLPPAARDDIRAAVAWAAGTFQVAPGAPLPQPLVTVDKDYDPVV